MNYEEKVNTLLDAVENMWIFIRNAVDRQNAEEDLLLTKDEAAYVLNCSTRTIARLQESREIEYVLIRGTVRFTKKALRDVIHNNTIRVSPKTKHDFERNFKTIISKRVQ